MKQYAIYVTNASNQNKLIIKDEKGNPFTSEEEAREYGNGIHNNTVAIIEITNFYVLHS